MTEWLIINYSWLGSDTLSVTRLLKGPNKINLNVMVYDSTSFFRILHRYLKENKFFDRKLSHFINYSYPLACLTKWLTREVTLWGRGLKHVQPLVDSGSKVVRLRSSTFNLLPFLKVFHHRTYAFTVSPQTEEIPTVPVQWRTSILPVVLGPRFYRRQGSRQTKSL